MPSQVMEREISLTLYDEAGGARSVDILSRRFTIGRSHDNDLVIENSGLSRRHAIIEIFDRVIQISDCDSRNGTLVNGKPIVSFVELYNGDVITLGGACDITINVRDVVTPPTAAPLWGVTSDGDDTQPAATHHWDGQNNAAVAVAPAPPWLNPHVLAVGGVAAILLCTGLFVALNGGNSASTHTRDERNAVDDEKRPTSTRGRNHNYSEIDPSSRNESPRESPTIEEGVYEKSSDKLEEIESYARSMMISISRVDRTPDLKQKPLKEVSEKILQYKRSPAAVARALLAVKHNAAQIEAAAGKNKFKPAFLAYAVLAKMDRDNRGDPLAVTREMLPRLISLRAAFSDERAEDCLLFMAGYEEGASLAYRASALARQPGETVHTARDVWHLRQRQKIGDRAYNLLLRFLAIGVIAQDPQKFGVDAEPLTFKW